MQLYCDESGNTGVDLLNRDQPALSLASTCLTGEVAAALVAPLLGRGQKEVKYRKLRGTGPGQKALIEFFSSPELQPSNSKFTVVDKTFYLVSHLVDKLIEPCMHEDGVDLYANDAHIGLANVWFYTGFTIFPNGHWNALLRAFLQAIRLRSRSAFAQFDIVLTSAAACAPTENHRFFAAGLLAAHGRLDEFIGVYRDLEAFDPACDAFMALMQKWMSEVDGEFTVTHDLSKPLKRSEKFLRAMMTPAPRRVIGYRGRQGELPLRISSFDFGDSILYVQLQVADIIAGAAIDFLLALSGRKPAGEYHAALRQSQLPKLFVGGMLPSPTIEKTADPRSGERSLVDGATQFLREVGYFD